MLFCCVALHHDNFLVRGRLGKGAVWRRQGNVVGLRRAAGAAGAQLQHVRLFSRRAGEGDGVQAGRHTQPCRQVPTVAEGDALLVVCLYFRMRISYIYPIGRTARKRLRGKNNGFWVNRYREVTARDRGSLPGLVLR